MVEVAIEEKLTRSTLIPWYESVFTMSGYNVNGLTRFQLHRTVAYTGWEVEMVIVLVVRFTVQEDPVSHVLRSGSFVFNAYPLVG